MGPFGRLYDWMMRASRHRHANWYLGAVSAAESSFFPIPPDVMLAPMTLARPRDWAFLALLTTAASVLGGLLGYAIGHFLLDAALPLIERLGYLPAYVKVGAWFERYGFWAVFVAGFTPVPYKIFTISAGAAQMGLLPFVVGSLVGRGGRFLLVAGLIRIAGPRIEPTLRRYVDAIGWTVLVLLAVGLLAWQTVR
ncbi:MAG: YqaA family protein [Sinimarinibacterium flocculans]|jgi:membrane protein YqaA with SNARE-associated domain|uniref:Membrane protein YqaA with SNARE-associated domain n=1 Tax=Sinimarinibacterium flocculans TaxID=985250 RepID=A0A318EE18_9GAMM|nr:YqaA family protein [Sinimarinibacterium flocculans]PXV68463.1 membrane protein YqaA with SNARE-associated domain [Sinimarinibacterium flocculans]